MTITIGLAELREIVDTTKSVGMSGVQWLDSVYFRSVEDDMLLVTVGNRYVQHFIEFYSGSSHLVLGDEVIGIPFDVLVQTDWEARKNGFRTRDSNVTIGWNTLEGGTVIGNIEVDCFDHGRVGYQTFEVVAPQSDVLDVCAPHFYAEDSTRFRIEDAPVLARRLKTAARLFDRDDMKRCKLGWSSASVANVELLKEYDWQIVINARITGEEYSSVVEQFPAVSFNPELLAAVLGIGDRVVVSLKKEYKGCLFTAGYHTVLLMPVRN